MSFMLFVVMPRVIMLGVIMLSAIKFSVVVPSVIMPSVMTMNVVAPIPNLHFLFCVENSLKESFLSPFNRA
jgi:hypothetical protein